MVDLDVRVRNATPEDSDFVYTVKKAALREYVEATWGWDEAFQREFHDRDFRPAATKVICVGGVDAGWIVVTYDADRIELNEIYLLPSYQRRGVGTKLILDIAADGQRTHRPVELQVLKVNVAAKQLYERLGFCVYDETETHLRLRLTA